MREILRSTGLLVVALLLLGGVVGLGACGGSGGTTTVTTTMTTQAQKRSAHKGSTNPNGPPAAQRRFERRHFGFEAPSEMRRVIACLTEKGFSPSRRFPGSDSDYAGFPHFTASVRTDAGYYRIVIFPNGDEAYAYAVQQSYALGHGGVAAHGMYEGTVSLVSISQSRTRADHLGDESHAYYVERSAIAACAFSIPAAIGRPAYVS